jgi:hypothetical protein
MSVNERISRVRTFGPSAIFVSTVGMDEESICEYIKKQEKVNQRIGQLDIFE